MIIQTFYTPLNYLYVYYVRIVSNLVIVNIIFKMIIAVALRMLFDIKSLRSVRN